MGKDLKGDSDVKEAKIDAETTAIKDMWAKEIENLEAIRDQARAELKSIKKMQIISELAYRDLSLKYGQVFTAGIGAEALQGLLEEVNLEELATELEANLNNAEGQAAKKLTRRLKLIKPLDVSLVE
jgi:DNA-directed RNA polymerase subunit beta'